MHELADNTDILRRSLVIPPVCFLRELSVGDCEFRLRPLFSGKIAGKVPKETENSALLLNEIYQEKRRN